jgi:hypothetical protein
MRAAHQQRVQPTLAPSFLESEALRLQRHEFVNASRTLRLCGAAESLGIRGNSSKRYHPVAQTEVRQGIRSPEDAVETYLNREVCCGAMALAEAEHEIAADWMNGW